MAASMVRWFRGLYVFFLTCLLPVSAFLNLEELNEMKYGIQILPDPVIVGQAKSQDVMLVSNKYRQLYECHLPAQAIRFHQDPAAEPDPQGYIGPGIPELLRPMSSAPCLVKTKDWWTYEFCYGQYIRQYHLEDSEIKGDMLFLGYYESEFDWNNETAKASKLHRLKRYHSQSYVNGSKCDLNGKPRETEVRFLCEEGSGDYVARVDEPQSCRYVLTVHTTRTCHHPFLRPPSSAKPQGIVCQPALSPQQYMDYVKAQVSDTKRKVEQISEELKSLDEILAGDEATNDKEDGGGVENGASDSTDVGPDGEPDAEEPGPLEDSVVEDLEDSQFWEGVTKPDAPTGAKQVDSESLEPQLADGDFKEDVFGDEKFNFKIITDPSDLMKFVKKLKEGGKKAASEEERQKGESQNEKESVTGEKERAGQQGEEEEEEEKDVLGDSEDEHLLQEFEEEIADLSVPSDRIEEIKEEMQKEFDDIIDEAQQELETEGLKGEFDRSQATQTLETTLDKLLDRLEDREDEEHRPDGGQKVPDPSRGSPSSISRQPDRAPVQEKVKIRVTKYKQGSSPDRQLKVQEMSEGDPQLQQIKDVVKEQLERAGLKAEGKIEVKILTRRTADEVGDQWLSEEDTKSFRELLINLLTGGTEEVYKEQKRQQELENNYRFVWGEKQEETQPSGAADSDDVDF
ncbi:protein OS-9 isoform X2 [Paramormyrops kingsleyae]|uniref:protein OS-9 isoform X2 n=1 Tax=Paramormyrops kingsleyae TaxID=1676925 RepID=UPI003B96AF78